MWFGEWMDNQLNKRKENVFAYNTKCIGVDLNLKIRRGLI